MMGQQAALNELETFLSEVLRKEADRAGILSKRLAAKRETLRLVKRKGG